MARFNFTNTKSKVVFTDSDNVTHNVNITPAEYEGYLMAGQKPHEFLPKLAVLQEIESTPKEERTSEQKAQVKKLDSFLRVRQLAQEFANANRYLLDKDDITEKDVRYAFKELPAKEKDTEGKISPRYLKRFAPSNIYKGVVFEKLFGGIRELELVNLSENEQIAKIDKYMTQQIHKNPELFGMIVKYWKDGNAGDPEELVAGFLEMLGNNCILPAYFNTNFNEGSVSIITYGMATRPSTTKQLILNELQKA